MFNGSNESLLNGDEVKSSLICGNVHLVRLFFSTWTLTPLVFFSRSKRGLPGTEVPRATKAMALTESLRKMKQPKWPATSPMMAVQNPIAPMDATNVK